MIRVGQGMSEYTCPLCGSKNLRVGRFILVPAETRAYRGQEERLPEYCMAISQDRDKSGSICRGQMVWTPTTASHDLLGENFIVDVGNGPQKFSSLSEVRTLERDSLRRAANGEGAPLNFRHLSQNRSNRDVNTFKGSSYEKGKQVPYSTKTQSGQPITAKVRREQE